MYTSDTVFIEYSCQALKVLDNLDEQMKSLLLPRIIVLTHVTNQHAL